MDLITHSLLGATIGQAGFRKKLGRPALLWGSLGALVPDLDVIIGYVTDPIANLKYHRGITHSLWFGPLVGMILGYIIWRYYTKKRRLYKHPQGERVCLFSWMLLMGLVLLTHPILDLFTGYGTQLLAPFSNYRYAINAVSVVDWRYTLPLFIAVIVGIFKVNGRPLFLAQPLAILALLFSTSFLFYGWHLNNKAITLAHDDLKTRNQVFSDLQSYPLLFQPYRRHVVARNGKDICVAEVNTQTPRPLKWQCTQETNIPQIKYLRESSIGKTFEWFAQNQTFAEIIKTSTEIKVRLYDLRYPLLDSPLQGMWGIEAVWSQTGIMQKPPYFFQQRPKFSMENFLKLWKVEP
ncbi:MAG: hypothetical protein BGO77_00605 [Caedibacter sp. 37-49]|nr:MAG: hypothetical protein BGO77_00605 [Caedibacter sp. 37-49]